MATFNLSTKEKTKKQKKLRAYFYLTLGLLGLVFFFFFDDRSNFIHYAAILIFINGIWMAIDTFKNLNKTLFVDIDEYHIEWCIYEKNQGLASVEWKDVRWIKKEMNGSVSIFLDSSFNKNISLTDFSAEDQTAILHLLQKYGTEKQIRLVNFSEPVLATA